MKDFADIGDDGRSLADELAGIGRREGEKPPMEKTDSIEYEHGSLGIVPRSAEDV